MAHYYQQHIGDYAKDTAHLSMLEHGAYRLMLDIAYATEKPLPRDQQAIYRLVRARSHAEKLAVDVVLGEFWIESEDGWHNKRAEEELAKTRAKSEKARGSAAARWGCERISERNANAVRTHSERNAKAMLPIPKNQEPTTPLPPSGAFARFWAAWPSSSRKAARGKCLQLWTRGGFDAVAEQIVAHVEAMKLSLDWRKESGAFIPAPLVYLNQRRWEGADDRQHSPAELKLAV